uniref:Uncharacterized protein n=1 Tax=Cacopsylla melanoneura TaxID=428564 RepID=A0A8D8LRP8_9HEMI
MLNSTRLLLGCTVIVLCFEQLLNVLLVQALPLKLNGQDQNMVVIQINLDNIKDQTVVESELKDNDGNQNLSSTNYRVENSKEEEQIGEQKGRIAKNPGLKDNLRILTNPIDDNLDRHITDEHGDNSSHSTDHKASNGIIQKEDDLDSILTELAVNLGYNLRNNKTNSESLPESFNQSFLEGSKSLHQDLKTLLDGFNTIPVDNYSKRDHISESVPKGSRRRRCYSDDTEGPSASDAERDDLLDDVINNPEPYQAPSSVQQQQQQRPKPVQQQRPKPGKRKLK